MEQKELNEILESHKRWLQGEGGERADLYEAYLRGADLREADLTRANLRDADLTGANLRGADLVGAYLTGADFTEANLAWAGLGEADLTGADLTGADLAGANLRRTNLRDADLTGVNLRFAVFTEVVGLSVLCVQVNTSRENRRITYIPSLDVVTAGCFQGTFEEFEKRVEEEHKDNPFVLSRYRRVIAFLKREAEEDRAREKDSHR